MKKRIFIILGTVLLVLGMSATAAQAAWSDCGGTGRVCAWEHSNGGGLHIELFSPIGSCAPVPSGWNDRISSAWNRFTSSGGKITFYYNAGCSSWRFGIGPNTQPVSFGWPDNDSFSSYCIGPTNAPSVGCGRY